MEVLLRVAECILRLLELCSIAMTGMRASDATWMNSLKHSFALPALLHTDTAKDGMA